jgi:hypothetical protein
MKRKLTLVMISLIVEDVLMRSLVLLYNSFLHLLHHFPLPLVFEPLLILHEFLHNHVLLVVNSLYHRSLILFLRLSHLFDPNLYVLNLSLLNFFP